MLRPHLCAAFRVARLHLRGMRWAVLVVLYALGAVTYIVVFHTVRFLMHRLLDFIILGLRLWNYVGDGEGEGDSADNDESDGDDGCEEA